MADRIVLNTISYHGHGAIENIVPELTARGYKKAFVCSDPDLIKFGVTKKVTDLLDAANFAYAVYSEIKPNPTIANVQDGVAAFKAAEADCIVTIGGGSSMDCAKGVGARLARPNKSLAKMEGILHVMHKLPLLIAVPTTAGTGSETTLAAVITDADTHHKYAINDFSLIPHYAVLEPEVTVGLPPQLTATTGMDALTHAATLLGITVVGALIPTVVKANIAANFKSGDVTLEGQAIVDQIMPSLVPVLVVAGIYFLLGKKKMTSTKAILIIMVASIVFYAIGLLA